MNGLLNAAKDVLIIFFDHKNMGTDIKMKLLWFSNLEI